MGGYRGQFFYLGGGVKCDYDGHEKRFYNNVMLGTTAGCWHTCAYRKDFPDYCHDNKLVQAKPRFNPSMNKTGRCWKPKLSKEEKSSL
jgi:hypothetical protein